MNTPSPLSAISAPHLWYEELISPLFWLTDPTTKVYKNDLVILCSKRRQRVYYLNGREKVEQRKARRRFFTKQAVDDHISHAQKFLADLKTAKYTLESQHDLWQQVLWALKRLNTFNELYNKTDGTSLEKLRGEVHSELKRLGETRLLLRVALEKWYTKNFAKLIRHIAKSTTETELSLYAYTFDELRTLIACGRKIDPITTKQRNKGYCLIIGKGTHTLLIAADFLRAQQFLTKYDEQFFTNNQLQGRVASPGSVVGRVRVILHNLVDLSPKVQAFQIGEILVAESTRPGIILACQKAAAIITDEGGQASHAAIIARELNIPCIVGTKIASRVLKTGDLVEVDANKGIVTVLKRS